MFNGNTPITTHSYLGLSLIWSCDYMVNRQYSTKAEVKVIPQVYISPSPQSGLSPLVSTTPDSIIRLPSLLLLLSSSVCKNNLSTSKSKMASSHHNSSTSTPVPLLGTLFNTISCFSDYLAYLPNALWCFRWIHQKDCLSFKSLSSTIQSGWIALPIPRLSIVSTDNNPNWKDTPTTNLITNLTANRSTSSTHSWSKPY